MLARIPPLPTGLGGFFAFVGHLAIIVTSTLKNGDYSMSNATALVGDISSFIEAYKKSRKVRQAEQDSKYLLHAGIPPAGFYVYALIDPENDEIFYIGKGIGGRVLKHEERTRRGVLQNKEKVKRIQKIFASSQEVERRILFCSNSEEVTLAIEANVVRELAALGLTNIIGGSVTQHKSVRSVAEALREKLDKFRTNFYKE